MNKKANKRRSILPLYVYLAIKKHTNCEKHLKQSELPEILEKEYKITCERQSLNRTVHSLADDRLNICYSRTQGVWMEQ